MTEDSMRRSPDTPEARSSRPRRRIGPSWFWALVGALGIGQPIVDRDKMYGADRRNDPYDPDFDPNGPRRP